MSNFIKKRQAPLNTLGYTEGTPKKKKRRIQGHPQELAKRAHNPRALRQNAERTLLPLPQLEQTPRFDRTLVPLLR